MKKLAAKKSSLFDVDETADLNQGNYKSESNSNTSLTISNVIPVDREMSKNSKMFKIQYLIDVIQD